MPTTTTTTTATTATNNKRHPSRRGTLVFVCVCVFVVFVLWMALRSDFRGHFLWPTFSACFIRRRRRQFAASTREAPTNAAGPGAGVAFGIGPGGKLAGAPVVARALRGHSCGVAPWREEVAPWWVDRGCVEVKLVEV